MFAFLLFQKNDIAMAVTKYDQFDFLIDIVPRDEIKATKRQVSNRLMFLVNMTCFIKVGGHDGEGDKRRERCHILAFEHILANLKCMALEICPQLGRTNNIYL